MPGIVLFSRRWSVGSDDFIIPAIILLIIHSCWLVVLSLALIFMDSRHWRSLCMVDLHEQVVGYIVILSGCVVIEACIAFVSMKGSILNTGPRASMQYLLYVRLVMLAVEICWLILGVIWIRRHYDKCSHSMAKEAVLGVTICNWCVVGSVIVTSWCIFDPAGRSWVKMKRYQNSLKDGQSRYRYKRSGNGHRNWRHRCGQAICCCCVCMATIVGLAFIWKAMRAYQDSWNRRCRILFCCLNKTDRHQNSFSEISKLLSEFFRDLDVVPSDVIAGLILLRKFQKMHREYLVKSKTNDTYQFLSGVAITPATKFLDVTHSAAVEDIRTLIHYLHYAVAVYGWPMFMMVNSSLGCCQLCPYLRCSRCVKDFSSECRKSSTTDSITSPVIIKDNCCACNYAALQRICQSHKCEVIYVTYHVGIGEPPFFVALDHERRTVVLSVRGTLSLQDVITDLNAEGDLLPTNPRRDNWLGHKGMVEAAAYIRRKLSDEKILQKALNTHPERGTHEYSLVLVGHSLGAGTAAILAILLREDFPDLRCYAFSPPGGLLSLPATEYTKSFITSVVLGKDVVPRLGLHQMESLRFDLINSIKEAQDPKWKIISKGFCCCTFAEGTSDYSLETVTDVGPGLNKDLSANPNDASIALTVHQPLYPPGKIVHIVRNHPNSNHQPADNKWRNFMHRGDPVYQALWANNTDFDQIIISPVMIQDHMPDKLMEALERLLVNTGPPKPQRHEYYNNDSLHYPLLPCSGTVTPDSFNRTPSHRLVLETSFTDLQPVGLDSESNGSTNQRKYERPTLLSTLRFHRKLDLINDDWMGMAPLASPETLSEASSISSKSVSTKFGCNNHNFPMMEPIEQSPSQKSQETPLEADVDVGHTLDIPQSTPDTSLNIDVDELFRSFSEVPDSNKDESPETAQDDEKSPPTKPKRVTFDLTKGSEANADPNESSRSSSSDVGNEVQRSTLELSAACEEPLPPLRRSYEKINISELDDLVPVFDSTTLPMRPTTSAFNADLEAGELSPTSQLLFQKLLTIESPVEETPCDALNVDSFNISESNL